MAIASVAAVTKNSSGGAGFTSDPIDTTGASLIVIHVASYIQVATPTDSQGNTYTALTEQVTDPHGRLFYCVAPSVNSGHTFTNPTNGSYASMHVRAFSGTHASPFDQQNGTTISANTSGQPGSITPSEDGCLVITGLGVAAQNPSIGGGYTAAVANHNGGSSYGSGLGYLIQTTAGATNPTWSWTENVIAALTIASFKPAAAAGGQPTSKRMARIAFAGYQPGRGIMGI